LAARAFSVFLFIVLAAAAGIWFCRAPAQKSAYSVQMHLHGSFSEGEGSIDSHLHEAKGVGVDVIWWSDHDWRIGSYRHVSSFSFEALEEPLDRAESWTAQFPKEKSGRKSWRSGEPPAAGMTANAELTRDRALEGEQSLRIEGKNDGENYETYVLAFEATRAREKRPLASDITLHIGMFPESAGTNGRGIVVVKLSEHPSGSDRALMSYSIRYVLDNAATEPQRFGNVYQVPLGYVTNSWNRFELEITQDAARGFPSIRGEDNSLVQVSIGIESRKRKLTRVLFDDFRIEQSLAGGQAFEAQQRLIDEIALDYPTIRQLQGVEVSYLGPHINVFAVDTALPDYDLLIAESGISLANVDKRDYMELRRLVVKRIVQAVHRTGGLVSLNHRLGPKRAGVIRSSLASELRQHREKVAQDLVRTGAYRADLLEVGYRHRGGHDLADHLWLWDELAKNGLHLVGTGVSDSHGGTTQRWLEGTNNFVSWVYADAPDKPELIDGMRRGRVFFGDIVDFDGTVDLATDRGLVMGQIVLTDRADASVTFEATGLDAGDQIQVVESGRTTSRHRAKGSTFSHTERFALTPDQPAVVRFEVYDATGKAKVFSNPITFVRHSKDGIPAARAAIDVGGVMSRVIEGISLAEFRLEPRRAVTVATLEGKADRGRVELAWGSLGEPSRVDFFEMSGRWFFDSGVLTLSELSGEGRLEITVP
jgi:hypothetical protein